ncbi:MAG TPA: DUF1629 domain-containing protein [Gemmatimonadaceae bacterium]|nr:DUF1629 domain-containing protein [Gemmatimonadaceae bacterium]
MRLYRIVDDLKLPGRWFLGHARDSAGAEFDVRRLTVGVPSSYSGELNLAMRRVGRSLDFTFSDFDLPILRAQLAARLRDAAPNDIQLFPVRIDDVDEKFDAINVVSKRAAIDEQNSIIERWSASDGAPEKIGQYFMINKLRVDAEKIDGASVFRLDSWEIALIVTEEIRNLLLSEETTGVNFIAV